MAKHTEGAVHLTSLSLDLTQFNENIQQIQNSTAEVADVAVQNLSKIKEALNVPVEQMRLSVDTTQLTQNMDAAAQSAQNFSQKVSGSFKQIENAGKLTDENISSLLKGLDLDRNTSAVTTLENLRDALSKLGIEYNKISLTTKDGDLFRAVAESADESGRKIQSTFDLTGDTVERIKAQIVESSKQTSMAFKEQIVSADELKIKLKDLEIASKTFSAVIGDSDIKSTAMEALIQQSAKFESNLQDTIDKLESGVLTTNQADTAYKNLSTTLSQLLKLWGNVNREAKTAATATTTVDEINELALNYANLAKQLNTTKSSNLSGIQGMAEEVKAVEEQLKSMAQTLANDSSKTKEYTDVVDQLSAKLVIYKTRLADAEQEQNKYVKSLSPIQKEAQEAISSLKTLEKTAIFKTSKDQVAALHAKYEEFLNTLKNTNISVNDAEKELADLQSRFNELETTVKRGNGTLENWVNKITESAKWQIANRAINLLQQSFGQLTTTIIDTEDAIIELRRVLNDKNLVSSEMTQTLYDIAYEFGQTFENVQEVAVKFAQTGKTWEETVAATRATMLGLNTAELEVSTATEGLIAVMAQFNVEADDLEKVIDKINITADNFPVTSEKIVAALQRAGGTARAFGLTLDETIGVITALSKATGRAGEAIGTAMNSLITFSMKSSSLDKFSEFLGQDVSDFDVLELWQALAEEINNGNESLATMMSTSEEFNSLMDEELASSIGLTEEFTKAQEEANKMTAEGKDIYSTVGTYRQNYFIALLNNIATAIEAIKGMSGAVGYSMQENEIAMESFSKKWNQLIIAAKELAIQFGNMGFLDAMKQFAEITTEVSKLTKAVGGLNTIMWATISLFTYIKRQKFTAIVSNVITGFSDAKAAVSLFREELVRTQSISQAFSGTMSVVGLTAGGIASGIGIAVTAISVLVGAYKNWKEKAEEAKRAAIEANKESVNSGKEAIDSVNKLAKAYSNYNKALEGSDIQEQNKARQDMLDLLDNENRSLEELKKQYKDYDSVIKDLAEDEFILYRQRIEEGRISAAAAYKDIGLDDLKAFKTDLNNILSNEIVDLTGANSLTKSIAELDSIIADLGVESVQTTAALENLLTQPTLSYEEAKKKYETLIDLIDNAYDFDNLTDAQRTAILPLLGYLGQLAKKLKVAIKNSEMYEESWKKINPTLEETASNVDATGNALDNSGTKIETVVLSLEDMEKAIDDINKKMDSFQSSVKSVESIIEQYNKTGVMTADMLQTLIGLAPEYIDLIDINSNSLSLNQEKLENLMQVNDNYMVQMAAMKIAKEYEALATELQNEKYDNLTAAEIQNMIVSNALGGEIYDLAMKLYSGQINADQFKKGIQQAGEKSGMAAAKVEVLTGRMTDLATSMGGVIKLAGMFPNLNFNASMKINGKTIEQWSDDLNKGYITPSEFQEKYRKYQQGLFDPIVTVTQPPSSGADVWFPPTTTKSGGGAGSNTDKFKAEKDALNDLLEVYEHSILLIEKQEKDSAKAGTDIAAIYRKMQDEVHKAADEYRAKAGVKDDEYTRSLQKKWLELQEKIEEALHGIYEETVASYERAINYLEHQYDSAEQRLDYSFMGENLKKQLDYQVKIQREAERELERLAKLGKDVNSEAAQDVIDKWYDAEKAIRDISQKIQESILQPYNDFIDLADKFDIWDYMDFTKVDYLRMELQEINNMLADGTMSLKEYNAQLKQVASAIYDAQKELFDKQKADVEAAKDEVVKGYQSDINSLKDQKEQIEDYYKTVTDGYNAEIDAWEKRKDKVSEYYDTLIDNLNDVQAANERINAQVDYYNERQKIVTNLEQAQARSGVEWREKEMEYQQSLIDLDEEWNRTQKEWDIQDQIEMLNKLKEQALADINLSIEAIRATIEAAEQAKTAAIESIETEIAGIEEAITATEQKAEEEIALIDEQFKMLSQTIAEAIKNGTADGVANTQAELDKALVDSTNAMLSFIDSTNQTFTQTSQETANTVYGIYDTSFIAPMYSEINNIASHMQTAMTEGASGAAQAALEQFRNSLITPLKNEMASILSQSEKAKQTIATTTPKATTTITGTSRKFVKPESYILKSTEQLANWNKTGPNIYITNHNLTPQSAARRTQAQIVQSILNSK